ncbi:MAG: YmdB family metallophosphoesterase [Acholeplasmatales bacterium]|nr:YmdB family metallophosphoesterase [Acholeplasmatales bacterium]
MRILYFGDIVGENTIKVFQKHLEEIKKEYKINIALCNAENVTNGKGLSFKHYKALKSLGFSGMSMGNHTFSKKEIKEYIDEATVVRPANLNTEYGKDVLYIKYNDKTIALVNMLGRVYSNTPLDCPFKTMDKLLNNIKADYIIVDFHADATSEKKAFFYDFSGKVSAVLGSHTHIQTSDEEVYNNTCYITDMGMCGPKKSVIGDDVESIIKRFRTGIFDPLVVSNDDNFIINGVVLDLNDNENKIIRFTKFYKLED